MVTVNRWLRAGVSTVFLVAVVSQVSFGQLRSRPASVMLIATLESLSVTATPAAAQVSFAADRVFVSRPVEVTTAWAVPAHCTTLRLVGGLSGGQPVRSITSKASLTAYGIVAPSRTEASTRKFVPAANDTPVMKPGDSGLTLMKQAGGRSNRADSRTNRINLEFTRRELSRSGSEESSAILSIRMEAL